MPYTPRAARDGESRLCCPERHGGEYAYRYLALALVLLDVLFGCVFLWLCMAAHGTRRDSGTVAPL